VRVGSGPQDWYISAVAARFDERGRGCSGASQGKEKLLKTEPNYVHPRLSRGLPAGMSMEGLADELANAIREHLGKSIIIGNSFGGLVAIAFAAKYLDLTERLILTNSAYAFAPDSSPRFKDHKARRAREGLVDPCPDE